MKTIKNAGTFFLLVFIILIIASPLHAQESVISPDRPSFSPGTAIVETGRMNVEFGYLYNFEKTGTIRASNTAPNLALRIGTAKNVELQIQWGGWNYGDALDGNKDPESELQDVYLGTKFSLLQEEKLNLSAIGLVSIPVGKSVSNSGIFNPTIGLIWDYAVTTGITAFGIFQGSTIVDGEREYFFQPAAGLSFAITEKAGAYVEYFGNFPLEKGKSQNTLNAGLSYLINNNLAFDIVGGLGLNDYSGNFVGTGMSIRF